MNQNFQSISLDNFEEVIDTRILEKGFEYYKNDAILTIEQIDKGIWEAIVSGNENYEVAIYFQDNIICLLYTSPSPRDATLSRMPSSA